MGLLKMLTFFGCIINGNILIIPERVKKHYIATYGQVQFLDRPRSELFPAHIQNGYRLQNSKKLSMITTAILVIEFR